MSDSAIVRELVKRVNKLEEEALHFRRDSGGNSLLVRRGFDFNLGAGASITETDPLSIHKTLLDAQGDLIAATGPDTPVRLPVGSDGQVLGADSGEATGLAWFEPDTGPPGEDGAPGADGADGLSPGVPFIYGGVGIAPTSGQVGYDGTTAELRISEADAYSQAVAGWLDTIDDSSSAISASYEIRSIDYPARFLRGVIVGPQTDAGTYRTILQGIAAASSPLPGVGDPVILSIERTGDKGDDGADGAPGADGADGGPDEPLTFFMP